MIIIIIRKRKRRKRKRRRKRRRRRRRRREALWGETHVNNDINRLYILKNNNYNNKENKKNKSCKFSSTQSPLQIRSVATTNRTVFPRRLSLPSLLCCNGWQHSTLAEGRWKAKFWWYGDDLLWENEYRVVRKVRQQATARYRLMQVPGFPELSDFVVTW